MMVHIGATVLALTRGADWSYETDTNADSKGFIIQNLAERKMGGANSLALVSAT